MSYDPPARWHKNALTLEDLAPYPRLSYEQGEHNSFYFSEEILSTLDSKKDIQVRDRATLFNLLIGLDGYTICSGVISEALNGPNIRAIPLLVDDYMEIGYLIHKKHPKPRHKLCRIPQGDIIACFTRSDCLLP